MFKVGDRVRIATTVFHETVGTVVDVIPGRSRLVPQEFVVETSGELHMFFEQQLVLMRHGLSTCSEVDR